MQRGFFLCWVSVPPNTVQILSEVFNVCAVGFRSRFVVVSIARPQRLCFRVSPFSSPPPPPSSPATLLLFLCLVSGNVTTTKTKQRKEEGRRQGARGVHRCGLGATMAGDHGNVHMVNSKQLREMKIEDAKSRGKIVSISLCLSLCESNSQLPVFVYVFWQENKLVARRRRRRRRRRRLGVVV